MPELDKAKNALTELGWSEYESRTYSALVQLGKATASKIAKNSNVPPNRVYQILSKLSERGVVHTTEARGSTTEYEATEPQSVLQREKDEFINKIDNALEALDELKERKQDTNYPVTYTIYGRRELSTYLQNTIRKAQVEVFIAVDTLLELSNRELVEFLNTNAEKLNIRVLTTERGVNDKYEIEIADNLHKGIGLKISDHEFATIFMVVDSKIMIYTAYGFNNKERDDRDYYGIYTEDEKTTKLLLRSFEFNYAKSDHYREEDKKAEEEESEVSDGDKSKSSNGPGSDKLDSPSGPKSGPTLG